MANRVPSMLRRPAAAVAALLLAAALSLAAAAPAHAAPPGGCVLQHNYNIDGNHNIHAHRLWACADGDIIPLQVQIQRFVSPGVWETVASGSGFTSYFCDGHPLNIYRLPGKPQFFNTCG